MRNRFPGECYRCKAWVEAGEGHFERLGSTWRVQHAACAIERRGEPDAARVAHTQRALEFRATLTGKRGNRARKLLREAEQREAGKPLDDAPRSAGITPSQRTPPNHQGRTMNTPTGSKGGAKLPDEVLERMADAAAGKFGWSYLNLEEGDPENPNGRRGYHDPEGDPTKLYFRTIAQAAWEASPGPGLVEALRAMRNSCIGDLVGASDGGTHVIQAPSVDAMRMADAVLSALSPTEPGQIKGGEDE